MYAAAFVALGVVILSYCAWQGKWWKHIKSFLTGAEGYQEPKEELNTSSTATPSTLSSYDARLYVLQTFDTLLNRKASEDEVAKYSALPSRERILADIIKDHDLASAASSIKKETMQVDINDPPDSGKAIGKAIDSDSDSDNDSDSDSGRPQWPLPLKMRKEAARCAPPKPYTAGHGSVASPDIGLCAVDPEEGGVGSSLPTVVLERADLLRRLRTLSDEVEHFRKYISLL